MRKGIFILFSILGLLVNSFGQNNNHWDKWSWLIGEWVGEGSGQTGQGGGTFTLKPDLDNKILIRKNHAEYPAAGDRPAISHDDLMIIYSGNASDPSKAIYFDNEGHVINYSVTYSGKTIVLTSDKTNSAPIFRLTYTSIGDEQLEVKFEMSQDGEKFATYTAGKCRKRK